MDYFVLAAILSGVFFAIVLFVEPVGRGFFGRLRRPYRLARIMTRISLWIFVLFIPFAVLWLISGAVHPRSSLTGSISMVVFSPHSRSAMLGVLFGALFLIWVVRLYQTPSPTRHADGEAKRSLPRDMVIEGYFLVALFVVGSLDVFKPLFDRISTLKVPGAEVTLSDVKSGSVQNAPQLVTPAKQGERGGGSTALSFLSQLPDIMDRDNTYLYHTEPPGGLSKTPDSAIKLANDAIAPLASCHQGLYRVSGSDRFTRDVYRGLDVPVHGLAHSVRYGTDADERLALIGDVADAYAEAASATIENVFTNNISLYLRDRQGAGNAAAATRPENVAILSNDCSSLLALYCRSSNDQDVCNTHIVRRVTLTKEVLRSVYKTAFRDMLRQTLDDDKQASERPYFAIVAASILSIIGQPEAAVAELDQWKAPETPQKRGPWYGLRARSTLVNFAEEWLRLSTPASQNREIRGYHIETLERVIQDLRTVPFVNEGFLAFRKSAHAKPTLAFDEAYTDGSECRLGDDDDTRIAKVKGGLALINYMQIYVDRAMDEPDFAASKYLVPAEKFLKELNVVDLGCLGPLYSPNPPAADVIANFRADLLRLNARWLIAKAASSGNISSADDVQRTLKEARDAVEHGESYIARFREEKLQERKQAELFEEKILPANLLETYDELAALESQLSSRLKGE